MCALAATMKLASPTAPSQERPGHRSLSGARPARPVHPRPLSLLRRGTDHPPPLIECLRCFDGRQTDLDLRSMLVRITGDLQVTELEQHLIETFTSAGFLEDQTFPQMKAGRQRKFAEAPNREPAHAGGAYPLETAALRETMARYMDGALPSRGRPAPPGGLCGIAAPHVSPEGGWQSYRAAYQALGPELKDRT